MLIENTILIYQKLQESDINGAKALCESLLLFIESHPDASSAFDRIAEMETTMTRLKEDIETISRRLGM